MFLLYADVTVYTYDSFVGKGTWGEWLSKEFERQHNRKVKFIPFGSAGEALNQLELEAEKTSADCLVGMDSGLLARARKLGAFEPPNPNDPKQLFFPFDYGYPAILYDTRRLTPFREPVSLLELSKDKKFRKKWVIPDPRTSSIGQSFLIWTYLVLDKNQWVEFWKNMKLQVLTVAPGWSSAYGMFLKKEAELVVSYTTSPAYHIEHEKLTAIQAVPIKDRYYRQVEEAGLIKYSKNKKSAQAFLKLLTSEKAQAALPTLQWMYPVHSAVKLPQSFMGLPKVSNPVQLDEAVWEGARAGLLSQWVQILNE